MFAQIEYPEKLLPEELDNYLANGWFRMRQTIFTTNFLHFNQVFYSAIWLRVALDDSIYDKNYKALAKLNKGFRTEIIKSGLAGISPQQEFLFQDYRQSVSFDVSNSLQELLFGNEAYNRFDTYEVNIYDNNTMIATGFFDLGKTSAAGITCIYDPLYKKYSLGRYLMYLKMDFCKKQHLLYFYPGYVVPGHNSFDYKLKIGKATLQYLQLANQQWLPYSSAAQMQNPLKDMFDKLKILQPFMTAKKIPHANLYYKFFEANLNPYYYGHQLFDFPVFLYCFPRADISFYNIIVYDVRDAYYHLLQCSSIINIGLQTDTSMIFDSELLKIERHLFSTAIPIEISAYLSDS